VVFVGRPTRRKGFFDAIEAWRISQCGETGAALLLAGISERKFADSVPNPPLRVTPLCFVAKLDSFYLAADVVFLPSHHEGFPYSLLERAVAGCLCLASDINGSATPPNAGVLCQQSDIEAFARALRYLQKHRSTIIDSGLLAHQWATKNFERSAICSAIHDTVRRHIVSTSISATTPHVQ
jgi:glycosyltransferase involved in cell wall biosynthesis